MTRKKWAAQRVTVNLAQGEVDDLNILCNTTGRCATDIIREALREKRQRLIESANDSADASN